MEEAYVLSSGQLGNEATGKVEQSKHAAADRDYTGRRLKNSRHQVKQRRLSYAVRPQDCNRLPLRNDEN